MRAAPILAAAAALAACAPGRGDLTVLWTFEGGKTCADVGVATIQVAIDGELLSPDRFSCASENQVTVGANLGRYLPGTYRVTVTGLDAGDFVVYEAAQNVQVPSGGIDVAIDLGTRLKSPAATADLTFNFDGQDCRAAGVDRIFIVFDPASDGSGGTVVGDFGCIGVDGRPVTSAVVDDVPAGRHRFGVHGSSRAGSLLYYTHNPPSTVFEIGLTSSLFVPSERMP